MSTHRFLNVSFWQDAFVLDLTPEEKYFYIYLMTNSKTSQIGIYELPYRVIELETGYNRETVTKLLQRFVEYGKIEYHAPTKEIYIKNWAKFNWNNSDKVITRVKSELENVKHSPFAKKYVDYVNSLEKNDKVIQYPYSMDSLWNKEKEKKEKEIKLNKKESDADSKESADLLSDQFNEWWSTYNKKTGKKNCEAKFKKCVKNDGFDQIMKGTKLYLATITDKKYQKNPLTFLNGEHYNDEYETVLNPGQQLDDIQGGTLDEYEMYSRGFK